MIEQNSMDLNIFLFYYEWIYTLNLKKKGNN